MSLSSMCGLHVPVCTPYNASAAPDETTDIFLRDHQTWHRASVTRGQSVVPCDIVYETRHDVPDVLNWTSIASSCRNEYLSAGRVLLASPWRSVQPSKKCFYSILDPLSNQSSWRMLQAAESFPRRLQTEPGLSFPGELDSQ